MMKAPGEGEPVALEMNRLGFSAFVLDYRVAPYRYPLPWMDAARAIRFVRYHAEDFGIRPDRIAVLGFSAGGHLAACTGVFWDTGDLGAADPIERACSRPDAMILCYPVIRLFGGMQHEGSVLNLLGESAVYEANRKKATPSEHITDKTPPCFLWHTADDAVVPAGNSIAMFNSLREKGVSAELHIFPHGRHGLALTGENEQAKEWVNLCFNFLKSLGF
jgi:acetyl esterase/lipase